MVHHKHLVIISIIIISGSIIIIIIDGIYLDVDTASGSLIIRQMQRWGLLILHLGPSSIWNLQIKSTRGTTGTSKFNNWNILLKTAPAVWLQPPVLQPCCHSLSRSPHCLLLQANKYRCKELTVFQKPGEDFPSGHNISIAHLYFSSYFFLLRSPILCFASSLNSAQAVGENHDNSRLFFHSAFLFRTSECFLPLLVVSWCCWYIGTLHWTQC